MFESPDPFVFALSTMKETKIHPCLLFFLQSGSYDVISLRQSCSSAQQQQQMNGFIG